MLSAKEKRNANAQFSGHTLDTCKKLTSFVIIFVTYISSQKSDIYFKFRFCLYIFLGTVLRHFVFLKHSRHVAAFTAHNNPDHQFSPLTLRTKPQSLSDLILHHASPCVYQTANQSHLQKIGDEIFPPPIIPETALQRISRHMEHPCLPPPTSETVHSSDGSAPPQHPGLCACPPPPP